MRKVKAAILSVSVCALLAFPLGSPAGACPDPDNPCDIKPYTLKEFVCLFLPTC
jgi:hypothetical protein